uniref:pseudouridine synthase n=1 Tax=uncultured Muribaculum sp. TaxID=1918613 RepID=UPI0026708C6B
RADFDAVAKKHQISPVLAQGYNNQNRQQQGGGFIPRQGKSFTPRPKRVEYDMPIPDPNEQIRLNKFMANAGICSRREADEYIQQGLVKVNGEVVTELGTKISHADVVEYDEKIVTLESKCYILLNKPKDCVTTSDDPNGRTTVLDLVKGACNERIYPVGRLDRNTTGVLLLTNDGDLASKLTHPKYVKKKIYHVWTDKDITEDDMQQIADGIELEDGPIHADAISYATDTDRNQAGIEIHSGRNRIVRRIFESLGYHVTKLDRVYFAGLTKKNLPRGRWRYLTQEEVNFLKMGSFE